MSEAGFLWDLRELDEHWVMRELAEDLLPPYASNGERVHAVVAEANVAGLWYRRDLLDATDQPPPTTWRHLVHAAKRIAADNPDAAKAIVATLPHIIHLARS